MIDQHPKHHRVVRHFIEKVHPQVELIEYDPKSAGMPASGFEWSDYDLLLIDNQLGEIDGVAWVQTAKNADQFPPFIILSSSQQTDTPAAMESVIRAIKMGAINYLFKKNIDLKKLHKDIKRVLSEAPERPDEAQSAVSPQMSTQQIIVRDVQAAVENTQHEIHLAMAMLEGHSEWPFTMEDILAGKANVGGYQVVSYLGNEMGGATFKVKREDMKEPQVMYFINRRRDKDGNLPDSLFDELEVMKSIDHPNLLPILNFQFLDDAILVVREHVEGETLDQRLHTRGVHAEQAMSLFRQILSGLVELHRHRISVEHYTPKSLRLDYDDNLVFANTGLLHRLHAINEVTSEMANRDAPMYASPEQVKSRTLDHRSDLYIAGLIGYEMLAGQPAFSVGSVKDILYAQASEPAPALPQKNHPMTPLLQAMLEKTPSRRIQTAQEVLNRLDNIMNSAA
jgi:DNA-binding response OmpR family regulator